MSQAPITTNEIMAIPGNKKLLENPGGRLARVKSLNPKNETFAL